MPRAAGILRNPDFLQVWTAQSVSMTGSQVSVLAIPLIAAVVLNASPFEMGVLRTVSFLPVLILGLPAGAWLDTVRRRPVMIGADLGRAAVLGLLPVVALAGALRMEYLYLVAFVTGGLSLAFDVAQSAWLPGVVNSERQQLLDANSKLELSRWTVQIGGPGLAAGLVQVAGAPLALLADCLSFAISALMLSRVRIAEPTAHRAKTSSSIWCDIPAGLRLVAQDALLRTMAVTAAISNVFAYAQAAVLLLFVTRDLALPPRCMPPSWAALASAAYVARSWWRAWPASSDNAARSASGRC